jgi:hypothetical protein
MRFRLRDVFWLIFIVALACLLWRERKRTEKLEREVHYFHSVAPPIALTRVSYVKAISELEKSHGVKIDVDWPSVTKATGGLDPYHLVTQNLVDGSLTYAIEALFSNKTVVEGTDRGILIRGRDEERDGPAKLSWGQRRQEALRKGQP